MSERPKIKLTSGQQLEPLHESDPVYLFIDGESPWVMIPAEQFLTGKPILIKPIGNVPSGFKRPN